MHSITSASARCATAARTTRSCSITLARAGRNTGYSAPSGMIIRGSVPVVLAHVRMPPARKPSRDQSRDAGLASRSIDVDANRNALQCSAVSPRLQIPERGEKCRTSGQQQRSIHGTFLIHPQRTGKTSAGLQPRSPRSTSRTDQTSSYSSLEDASCNASRSTDVKRTSRWESLHAI